MIKLNLEHISPKTLLVLYRIQKWQEWQDKKPVKELGTQYGCLTPSGERVTVKVAGKAALTQGELEKMIEANGVAFARFENFAGTLYTDFKSGEQKISAEADSIKLIEVELPLDF